MTTTEVIAAINEAADWLMAHPRLELVPRPGSVQANIRDLRARATAEMDRWPEASFSDDLRAAGYDEEAIILRAPDGVLVRYYTEHAAAIERLELLTPPAPTGG